MRKQAVGTEGCNASVDYDWHDGHRFCDMACQMERGFEMGETGVLVQEAGLRQIKSSS